MNDQLRLNHVMVQGYGIRQPGELCYEAFPFDSSNGKGSKTVCKNQKAVDKLCDNLNLKNVCGYITFVRSGVPDWGCEDFEMDIHLQRPKSKKPGRVVPALVNIPKDMSFQDLQSPMDSTEITSFNKNKTIIESSGLTLKSPDENYFAASPKDASPSNVFRSTDCNELLQQEIENMSIEEKELKIPRNMVSQSSIEIELGNDDSERMEDVREEYLGEVSRH